jgi:hypothetical protein
VDCEEEEYGEFAQSHVGKPRMIRKISSGSPREERCDPGGERFEDTEK